MNAATEEPYIIARFGDPPWPEGKIYLEACQERATRLSRHPRHGSSSQSRNQRLRHFGGAIRAHAQRVDGVFQPVILSSSGLSEVRNEQLVLRLAVRLEMLHPVQAATVATFGYASKDPLQRWSMRFTGAC
jgi:hypothetical protein